MDNEDPDKDYKIIVIGNSGVGKTSLITRYQNDNFTLNTMKTLGQDCYDKVIKVHEKKLSLAFWDTTGGLNHSVALPNLFRWAIGAIIVFDVSNQESFLAVKGWLKEISTFIKGKPFFKLLIGNKIDFERAVSTEDAKRFSEHKKITYKETSVKENLGVSESFDTLTELIFEYRPSLRNSQIKISEDERPTSPSQYDPHQKSPSKSHGKSKISLINSKKPPPKKPAGFFQRLCCCSRDYSS